MSPGRLKRTLGFAFILLLILAAVFLLFPKQPVVKRSFYHWKSVYDPGKEETTLLDSLRVSSLYLHFFDVTWDERAMQPVPVSLIRFPSPKKPPVECIPVVFITNDVFKRCPGDSLPTLAAHVLDLVGQIEQSVSLVSKEIQFDCDWTESTGQSYFNFLQAIRRAGYAGKLSATVRLHQVKYPERTGVPPVDRAMIMFYNMGKLDDPKTVNSIYDSSAAALYTKSLRHYPLPYDVALPVFSWGVHIRNGRVMGIENISSLELDTMARFLRTENLYKAKDGFFLRGTYYQPGDILRLEEMNPAMAMIAAGQLAASIKLDTFTVSLFSLNAELLKRYDQHDFEALFYPFEYRPWFFAFRR